MHHIPTYIRAHARGIPAAEIVHTDLGRLRVPGFADVASAESALSGRILRTPLLNSAKLDALAGGVVWLKAESLQVTSSFKARGALNALLAMPAAKREAGVIAYSTGNHGQAIAWAARQLEVAATIVMPKDAPANKVERAVAQGASVVRYDRARESREAIGMRLLREQGGTLIPPGDHPDVLAAQGTVALEALWQLSPEARKNLAVFAAPCGGGGLIAGSALVVNELSASTRICAVEPSSYDDTVRSLVAARRERNAPDATTECDALQAVTPAELPFEINRNLVDLAVSVSEAEVRRAVRFAVEELRIVVEPGGAVALAAALSGRLPLAGAHAVVVLSGGNIDTSLLTDILAAPSSAESSHLHEVTKMTTIEEKFAQLRTNDAPGQEVRSPVADNAAWMRGESLAGNPVDFSHGNVDANAFEPTPGSLDLFVLGVKSGGKQAYTEYRGGAGVRAHVAGHLGKFTGRPIDAETELIITPGTQGALFLAIASCVNEGDTVAIVQPDYFANRKLVQFMGGEVMPVPMNYLDSNEGAGIDLEALEQAFKAGATTFLFSNPNNPAGVVYSRAEIDQIAHLSTRYGVNVIVDQLYSRLLYEGQSFTHLRAGDIDPDRVITIMGPSKTESLSGYRLGVAFGPARLLERMERLQAIVSLRAPGYSQAVLRTWFAEPSGWMQARIAAHQQIRDDLIEVFHKLVGMKVRTPQAGSYLFPRLPTLSITPADFVKALRKQASVTVTPGTEFSPRTVDSIRLNFSQNHADSIAAAGRIVMLAQRYAV